MTARIALAIAFQNEGVLICREFLLVGELVRVRDDAEPEQVGERAGRRSLGHEVRWPLPELGDDSVRTYSSFRRSRT